MCRWSLVVLRLETLNLPQHEHSQNGLERSWNRRLASRLERLKPRSEQRRGDETRGAPYQVDRSAARHVNGAESEEEAFAGPDPVRRNTVDERVGHRECDVGRKLGSLRHGARDNGRGCCGKGQLEEEDGEDVARLGLLGVDEEASDAGEGVAAAGGAEAEPEAERPVRDAPEHDVERVLHHDVHLVLGAHAPGLQQAKACNQEMVFLLLVPFCPVKLITIWLNPRAFVEILFRETIE